MSDDTITGLPPETQNSFALSRATKPGETIRALHRALCDSGQPFELDTGQVLAFSDRKESGFILLLTQGWVSLFSMNTGLRTGAAVEPAVIGLADGYDLYHGNNGAARHYIRAEMPCRGRRVPADIFFAECSKLNLWCDISRILAHELLTASQAEAELVGHDAYGIIRSVLTELWLYPEELRRRISVCIFIQKKTNLSRSRVMGVLSALKQGGYIRIRAGRLTDLKKLPEEF